MLEHDVDATLVASMDSSNLQSVLQATPYQQGSVNQLNEGVNLLGLGDDPSAPNAGIQNVHQQYVMQQNPQGQVMVSGPPTGGMPGQGTSATTYGGNQQQDVERFRQIALQATQQRIQADEARFQTEIQHLPDHERERRVLERELEQAQSVNGWLNSTLEQGQQAQYQQQQATAKNMWGFIYANQHGLPYQNPAIKSALMAAESQEHMQQIAQGLVQLVTGGQSQQAVQQLQSGVFAAGGVSPSGGGSQSLRQFEGSGNLKGLISSRGYTGVNW